MLLVLFAIGFVGQKLLARAAWASDPHGPFRRGLGVLFILVGLAIMTGIDKRIETGILDAGFFDVTRLEQKLLERVPDDASVDTSSTAAASVSVPTQDTAIADPDARATAKARQYQRVPEITGAAGYINTPDGAPVTLASLRGQVVLVDFWTYSCINCQRTLPHRIALYEAYKDQGFTVIGVHTPEFAFEKVAANVADATERLGVTYPVVLDNDYATWQAFGNRYWPRAYLVDADGFIVYDHIGEGDYDGMERAVVAALAERARITGAAEIAAPSGVGVQSFDAAVTPADVRTPELYLGSKRNAAALAGERSGQVFTGDFVLPTEAPRDRVTLDGWWEITQEYARAVTDGRLLLPYTAARVYMVAGSSDSAPRTITVLRDGQEIGTVDVDTMMLYTLVDDPTPGLHTLDLRIPAGVAVYTFTFG